MKKVDKWKAALTEAADLAGYDLHNDAINGHEVRLIQIIVKKVLHDVKNVLGPNVAEERVRRDSRSADEIAQLSSMLLYVTKPSCMILLTFRSLQFHYFNDCVHVSSFLLIASTSNQYRVMQSNNSNPLKMYTRTKHKGKRVNGTSGAEQSLQEKEKSYVLGKRELGLASEK
ncbi:hypothetical protein POM88_000143 [Heracleum sosnowskyi]|uniref:Uncharacterized protein n=1 Tax=Heracleum sosnowskyi TaxID=360622 RepID=A0AAD8JAV9_9APIA|nr:hypothetical protein POM88_000143 [Heracleum sosnowskyi]